MLLIAPLAPHIAEELWRKLGHADSVVHQDFPVADPAYVVDETVTCVVQIKGKVKARLEVSPSISDEELEALALADAAVVAALGGAGIRKVIVRAPKLVNIVPALAVSAPRGGEPWGGFGRPGPYGSYRLVGFRWNPGPARSVYGGERTARRRTDEGALMEAVDRSTGAALRAFRGAGRLSPR